MSDTPLRRLDWNRSAPEVDYKPAAPSPPAPPRETPLREWEVQEIRGVRQESVQLPLALTARLKWMIPGTRDALSSDDLRAKRELLAMAGIFDASPHAYMARKLAEAIEEDFAKVDALWRERTK